MFKIVQRDISTFRVVYNEQYHFSWWIGPSGFNANLVR
jgi:hypothetical protein